MKAVIYARYSSDSQREESIEGQLRECKEYADRHGIVIIGTYIDRALSARTDERPEFQRMIKDSSKKQFEIVLVWKLDRFARSRSDSALNKVILKKNDVRVISAKENISEGPEGIILEAMLEGYAEYYSAELSEKIIRGLTENALKAKYNGGGLPFGYTIDDERHLQPDPVTSPVVREIFERYADGESIVNIAQSLNQRGIRTTRGTTFNRNSSLHSLLKNRKYIGEYKYASIVHPNAIPAIISPELFGKVQVRMSRNKKAPASAKAEIEYILTTKLFCGHCGAFMVGESGTSRTGNTYYYYKCAKAKRRKGCKKKAIKKEFIERYVVAKTRELALNDKVIEQLADSVVEYQKLESPTLPLLRQELKDTEIGIENMLDAVQKGIVTNATKNRLDKLEARKADLEIAIAQEEIRRPVLTKEQIIFWLGKFKDGNIDDPKYRKYIVNIFVNSVYVYDDRMILLCNYMDDSVTVTFEEINGSDLVEDSPPYQGRNACYSPLKRGEFFMRHLPEYQVRR